MLKNVWNNFLKWFKSIFIESPDGSSPGPDDGAPFTMPLITPKRPIISDTSHDCKCIHCHKEFDFEDYIGLCASRDCYNSEIFRQDIQEGGFNADFGPRQIMLRAKTQSNIATINDEYPIDTILTGKKETCPVCMSRIYLYACPHCRHAMPRLKKEVLGNMIAPAGIGTSGKSIYMTVLINYLMDHDIDTSNISVYSRFTETDDLNRYTSKYNSLIKYKERLASNQIATPMPYLLRTTTEFLSNGKVGDKKFANTLWYDFAGELFEDINTKHYVLEYYASVKGILFFVDPTNSPELIQKLSLQGIDNAENADKIRDQTVILQINDSINKIQGQGAIKEKFIAVIVNKVDLFKNIEASDFNHFREYSQVWKPSPHHEEGGFSLRDYEGIEREVIRYLKEFHRPTFNHIQKLANSDKSNIGYFAVSSLGHPLVDEVIEHDIKPIRVEDPFYWLLWKFGNLPAIKEGIRV